MVPCPRFAAKAAWNLTMQKIAMPLLDVACRLARPFCGSLLSLAVAAPALAGIFEFAPAPQTDLNRVYRIDRSSGEVGACQFQLKEGGVGITICFPSGEGAGPQPAGEYTLMPSRHEREGGIFRVNMRTGEMSICYVFDDKTVCTPQAK
jgi:hypothetical protein